MALEYLKNGICNFKFIGRTKFHKNGINIVSICLFKIPNSYKDFNIYINGLREWEKFLKSFKNTFIIRLFIDHHIYNDKNIMDQINNIKIVEPVLFLCADYVVNKYHIDLFSTMVRFFPLFNFKNNDAKSVLVADIDFEIENIYWEEDLTFYKYVISNSNKIKYFTFSSNFYENIYKRKNPYISAGLIFDNNKYNKKTILDFIQSSDKKKLYGRYYHHSPHKLEELKKENKYRDQNKEFKFGIDEIFLNEVFLHKEIKKFNVILMHSNLYLLDNLVTRSYDIYLNNQKSTHLLEKSINKVLGKNMSLKEYYQEVKPKNFKNNNKYCFNFKLKNCIDDSNNLKKIIKTNQNLQKIFKDFKFSVPKNTFLYQILNSEIINISKIGALLNLECTLKNKRLDSFKIETIKKTKY